MVETKWLAKNKFITGDHATIADIAAYVEIGQLQSQFTNLYDFEPFPNVSRWLKDMSSLKGHDDSHLVLTELGDINQTPPKIEDLMGANIKGLKHIALKTS